MRSMFIKGGKRVPEPLNTISSVIPAAPTQMNFLFVISDLLFANHVRDLLKVCAEPKCNTVCLQTLVP